MDVIASSDRVMIEPALLTIPEAMARLAVKRDTIYRLAREGRLELVHIGAASRITVRSVAAYLDELTGDGG